MVGGAALMALTAVSAAAFVAPTAAIAQDYTSGVLSGAVSDAAGAPVAGAAVTVTSAQGTVRNATTDANGSFRMPALPVGAYTVRIEQSGFATTTQRASVSPGGASYAFTLTPAGADGTSTLEDVVVTAQRVQDFNATDTGLSVDVQEFAERVPTGRSITAVTLFAPGASAPDPSINAGSRRNQSLVSLSGTSAAENVYYINGLNVTDQRSFLGFAELPFDFIQTIDTKTGGYQAEYGRGTGGVVNIVTRSGTNEWTGGLSTFWTPDSLRASRGTTYAAGGNNQLGSEVYNQYATQEFSEYTAYLGGPLWRDKLFFFGVYNGRDSEAEGARSRVTNRNQRTGEILQSGTISQTISSYDDPRWGVKLDFVINPDHRLEATYFNDETTTVSQQRTFSAASGAMTSITNPVYVQSGGDIQILKYTGVFTDWFTLSALYGKLESSYLDYGGPTTIPSIQNVDTGVYLTSGRRLGTFNLAGGDERITYRVDADLYFNLMGDHHLRIGYDKEEMESEAFSALSGGAYYYWSPNDAGTADDTITELVFTNRGSFGSEQTALYIQDSWEITPDLSVQLGLRNDQYDYLNAAGVSYVKMDDQWAPRLGFNWDPRGLGVDRIYGSLGDYYLPIASNTSIRASSGETYTQHDYAMVADANGAPQLDANGRPILGPRLITRFLSPPGVPDPRQVVEQDLKPMYEREFVIGYEHKFESGMFADWSAGVRFVHRNIENAIEDTQIGDAVARYCIRTNTTCVTADGLTPADGADFASLFNYVLINPGDEATVYVDLQADTRTDAAGNPNPLFNPQWLNLTKEDLNLQEVKRTYKALEFTFERPFDGLWSLKGSYTLANSEGNYEGAVKSDIGQLDTSLTQDYDHSANQLGAYGKLPNHHRHTLKMFGNWAVNDRLGVGANYTLQSGRPYGCIGRVPTSVDPYAPQVGTPSGWYCPLGLANATIQTPRGSRGETPWTSQLDLNFNYKLMEREGFGSLTASIDVFNVFDNDAVTRVVEQGMVRNDAVDLDGDGVVDIPTNYSLLAPNYGQARSRQAPRSVRFGLRYRF